MKARKVRCRTCHKDVTAHSVDYMGLCKSCATELRNANKRPLVKERERSARLMSMYGIDQADYQRMLNRQGGRCAICGDTPNRVYGLHVDHDHATEEVRGLLCSRCNTGLGQFRDNPEFLEAAAAYLRRPHVPIPAPVGTDVDAGHNGRTAI